jgi:Family of unknown function (DUF5703)
MAEYSYLVLNLPRDMSRDAARRILTDHAEYGHWELSRMRLYADGSRKATLRRKVIRAVRTQLAGPSQAGYPRPGFLGPGLPGGRQCPPPRMLPPSGPDWAPS